MIDLDSSALIKLLQREPESLAAAFIAHDHRPVDAGRAAGTAVASPGVVA